MINQAKSHPYATTVGHNCSDTLSQTPSLLTLPRKEDLKNVAHHIRRRRISLMQIYGPGSGQVSLVSFVSFRIVSFFFFCTTLNCHVTENIIITIANCRTADREISAGWQGGEGGDLFGFACFLIKCGSLDREKKKEMSRVTLSSSPRWDLRQSRERKENSLTPPSRQNYSTLNPWSAQKFKWRQSGDGRERWDMRDESSGLDLNPLQFSAFALMKKRPRRRQMGRGNTLRKMRITKEKWATDGMTDQCSICANWFAKQSHREPSHRERNPRNLL